MTEHLLDKKLFEAFHLVGLFVIGAAIVWASWAEVLEIIAHGGPKIKDVLLLFIYLELGAMVGIYFQTNHLPVRYLNLYRRHGTHPGAGHRHQGDVG